MKKARNLLAYSCVVVAIWWVHPLLGQENEERERLIYEHASNHWFEGPSSRVEIAGDGEWILFRRPPAPQLVSLTARQEAPDRLRGNLDSLARAMTCGRGLARFGQRGSAKGWFLESHDSVDTSIPEDAQFRCSADGKRVAYVRASRPEELVVSGVGVFDLKGRVTAVAFTPDTSSAYALVFGLDGLSTLVRLDLSTRAVTQAASGLDAPPSDRGLAMGADGHSLYLPLASAGVPNDDDRHRPDARRWLGIYRLDLGTTSRRLIVTSAHDNHAPAVANGSLYWVRNIAHNFIAIVPSSGGAARDIGAGQLPVWSPDGRRLSFVTGDWRLADWALNLDASVIQISRSGSASSAPTSMIKGYHEDFSAAWSPNGRWIAFHSHRSNRPVVEYSAPGSSDDIYLRRADDPRAPERRLTDFGWEAGPPEWSPDGRKLLFTSYEKGGRAGLHKVFVITLNPATGAVLNSSVLPLAADIQNPQMAAWSPDGTAIAIEDNRGGVQRALWVVRSDGSQPQRVVDHRGSSYGGVDWMSDGRTLVYSALADGRMQLFTVAPGGLPKQLSNAAGNLFHPQVSPDGKWIAATRIEQSHQIWLRPLPKS